MLTMNLIFKVINTMIRYVGFTGSKAFDENIYLQMQIIVI